MRWLTLVLLVVTATRTRVQCFEDVDGCGVFDPEARSERTGELLEEGDDDIQDRIVNGYKVTKMRPWMVRIGKVKKTKIHTFCGGS